MARKPRVFTDSQIYHIILRGNNQQNLFYSKNDRNFLLSRLSKYAKQLDIEIYGYCLMSNHVHILLGKANLHLSLFVQKLANSYVYYFNHKYNRSGHLFQGRFKSEPVNDDKYFKTVLRYIMQNPEKIHKSFSNYEWNSYKELISPENPQIITKEYVLKLFDTENEAINFLSQTEKRECMEYENKFFINDRDAVRLIRTIFDTNNVHQIIRMDINHLTSKLNKLKDAGLSINQISRITSIPKNIIKLA